MRRGRLTEAWVGFAGSVQGQVASHEVVEGWIGVVTETYATCVGVGVGA